MFNWMGYLVYKIESDFKLDFFIVNICTSTKLKMVDIFMFDLAPTKMLDVLLEDRFRVFAWHFISSNVIVLSVESY